MESDFIRKNIFKYCDNGHEKIKNNIQISQPILRTI